MLNRNKKGSRVNNIYGLNKVWTSILYRVYIQKNYSKVTTYLLPISTLYVKYKLYWTKRRENMH